jgi:hypothetical protein
LKSIRQDYKERNPFLFPIIEAFFIYSYSFIHPFIMPAAIIDKNRVAGSLYGLLVGDAIAVPVHWFYSPKKLRADYGELTEMTAPQKTHAESSEFV